MLFRSSIDDSPYEKFFSRVVLTGGCFKIDNMAERATPKFNNKAVRTVIEKNSVFYGDNEIFTMPEYTCLLGLCMYSCGFHTKYELNSSGVLLTRQNNSNLEKIIDFSSKEVENKENNSYYSNIDVKEQKLLNVDNNDKDEVLESLKINSSEEKSEGIFVKFWKKVCTYIERIF